MEDYILKHSGEEIDEFIDKFAEIESDIDEIRDGAAKGKTSVQGVKLNGSTITRKDENGIVDLGNTYVTTLVYKAASKVENTIYPWDDSTFRAPIIKHEFDGDTGVIYFSGRITTIGNKAFFGCRSLTSVTIPEGVTTIGDYAFQSCYSLTSITIPDSVTTIGDRAFYGCGRLTSITIPDSVTTIGVSAFESCSSLTGVYCKAVTPPTGGSYMFGSNASGRKIYVPMESVKAYKSATGWSFYAPAIVGYHYNVGLFKTINGESIVGDGDITIDNNIYITDFTVDDLISLSIGSYNTIEASADILYAIADGRMVGIPAETGKYSGYIIATRADWPNREELYLEVIINGRVYVIDGAGTNITDGKFTIHSDFAYEIEFNEKPLYIDWITLANIRRAFTENGNQDTTIAFPSEDRYNDILKAVQSGRQVYIKTFDSTPGYVELNISQDDFIYFTAIDYEGYIFQGEIANFDSGICISSIDYLSNRQDSTIEKMTNISWSDLERTRNNGELAPGTYYRIIDYVTTTTQENTSSAGNLFDVIVLALDKHTLSEEAYAIQSERDADGYFANSNLSAWKLWYCLDNDTTRFAWADETDGTGVIYRMVDEFENDCPYDFKNILFTRYELEAPSEYNAIGDDDKFVEQLSRNVRAMFDNDVASYRWAGVELGNKSWGGEPDRCYSETTENRHLFYTFSDITYYEGDIRALDASLSSSCNGNKIGARSDEYIMMLPNNVFLGNACNNNTFGDGCYNNTFGDGCYNNTFGDGCWDNTFGDECINNTFGNGSFNNAFGNWCNYNTFSYNCYNNTFGDGCANNTFGNESSNNAFDSWCNNNTFSYNCCYNTFGDGCCYNTFGNECADNTFGGGCYNNTFGDGCNYNTFVLGFYVDNTFGNWVQYIHITYDGEPEAATYLQNYHIANDVRGASEEPLVINAERSREYETTIAKNSNGEIVEFCLADFPSLIVKTLNTPV